MDENDPQLKLKLLQVVRDAPPDYPNIKKGIGCGAAAFLFIGALVWLLVAGVAVLSNASKAGMIIGMAVTAALIVGGIAAFRPPSR